RSAPAGTRQTGCGGPVFEQSARTLLPKRVVLLRKVRDKQIEQAVPVHVAEADSHVGRGAANPVIRNAPRYRFLLERPIVLIDEEPVRPAVVGDEDVGPAVAVKVGADNPEPCTWEPPQTGFH